MSTIHTALITGANAGLGKEAARQLALIPSTEKIYLGCRNELKANEAKRELEQATGRSIFEILILDTSSPASVQRAVEALPEPIDGLIMNAGGIGGPSAGQTTEDGVVQSFAVNVLGHAVLVDALLKADKLGEPTARTR